METKPKNEKDRKEVISLQTPKANPDKDSAKSADIEKATDRRRLKKSNDIDAQDAMTHYMREASTLNTPYSKK